MECTPARTVMSRRWVIAVSLLASLPTSMSVGAQTIVGRVLDDLTEAPVSTATLMLLDSTDTAVGWAESDSVGRFFLRAPGAGLYRLYSDRLAYSEILSETFSLGNVSSVELLVFMVPLPMELDALVVTAERRRLRLENEGFYRRRRASMGHFFDVDDILKWDPTYVTDLMRSVPGVQIRRSRTGGAVALTHRLGRLCTMKVVLDGFKADMSIGSLDDLVRPHEVIGVEIYPGGMGAPVQHRGNDSRCGIIMIWTR